MSIDLQSVSLRYYPDSCLSQKCVDVDPLDPDLPAVLDKMIATMFAFNGAGLAAPQVGLPWNVFVVDCGTEEEPRALVNPRLEMVEGELIESEESCLSLPGIKGKVMRHNRIIISCCLPRSEERITITLIGREARVFQHEYDHLQGIVYLDKMKRMAKMMAKKKYMKHKDEVLTLRKKNQDLRIKAKDLQKLLEQFENTTKEKQNVSTESESPEPGMQCGPIGDGGCSAVSGENATS